MSLQFPFLLLSCTSPSPLSLVHNTLPLPGKSTTNPQDASQKQVQTQNNSSTQHTIRASTINKTIHIPLLLEIHGLHSRPNRIAELRLPPSRTNTAMEKGLEDMEEDVESLSERGV